MSLYGDGSLIYLDDGEPFPPRAGSVQPLQPYRIGRLREDQVQAVLMVAVTALGSARPSYSARGADYFTTTFTLRAGIDKSVSVFGLEAADPSGPDAATWAALRALLKEASSQTATVLGGPIYAPEAFLARLSVHLPPAAGLAWPWPGLALGHFPPTRGNVAREGRLTAAEVAALGLQNVEGGLDGVILIGPDGKLYDLRVRPLFPEQAS